MRLWYWLDLDGDMYVAGCWESFDAASEYIDSISTANPVWIFDISSAARFVFVLTGGSVKL